MPFIKALGYNIHDPTEVIPEFTADFGTKKSDRVDYAIMRDGKPIILFECKPATTNLDEQHASQLFQYFTATEARFGVLTNGIVYRFHTDLDETNKMDQKPFLEFNMLEIDETLIKELNRFTKTSFDLGTLLEAASELKYTKEIKRILSHQLRETSDDFVRLFASQIYSGKLTPSVRERFAQITRQALNEFINDRVYDRLKSAMATEGEPRSKEKAELTDIGISEEAASAQEEPGEVTTEEELQGFYIIKAILCDVVDVRREFPSKK
jgi:predicted type IV restriction endonuclease